MRRHNPILHHHNPPTLDSARSLSLSLPTPLPDNAPPPDTRRLLFACPVHLRRCGLTSRLHLPAAALTAEDRPAAGRACAVWDSNSRPLRFGSAALGKANRRASGRLGRSLLAARFAWLLQPCGPAVCARPLPRHQLAQRQEPRGVRAARGARLIKNCNPSWKRPVPLIEKGHVPLIQRPVPS